MFEKNCQLYNTYWTFATTGSILVTQRVLGSAGNASRIWRLSYYLSTSLFRQSAAAAAQISNKDQCDQNTSSQDGRHLTMIHGRGQISGFWFF